MGAASSLHHDIRATLDKLDLLNPDDVDRGTTVVEVFAEAREEYGIGEVPPDGLDDHAD